jgi:hypothetical protein
VGRLAHRSATADGRSFPITWSPSVVAAVRSWQELAEVQWLTTWGHDANTSLRHLLELPELPVAGTYDDVDRPAARRTPTAGARARWRRRRPTGSPGRWWKFDVVRRIVRTGEAAPARLARRRPAGQQDVASGCAAHDLAARRTRPALGAHAAHLAAVEAFLRG